MNISENKDLKNDNSFKKSRNSGKIISPRKKVEDMKNPFLTRYNRKKNIFNNDYKKVESMSINKDIKNIGNNILKEEANKNKKNDNDYISNIREEKSTQYKLESSRNKSANDYSNIFNLSLNNMNGDKAKRKREFLSPIVDKMYKEYYIKNNIKEKNKENNAEIKKQTIKKLVPAFGRTNYESYN